MEEKKWQIWIEDKTPKEQMTEKEGFWLDIVLMFVVAPVLFFIWKGVSLLFH